MRSSCILLILVTICQNVHSKIGNSVLVNKIQSDIMKPVGREITLKPISAPPHPALSGRRHMDLDEICNKKNEARLIKDTPNVAIVGDYYDELGERDMITIRMPHHIDRHHFEVTTPEPYFTVGGIEAVGYHPPPRRVDDCERIYQEHLGEQYSDESADVSQESLEMIRMPVAKVDHEKVAVKFGDYEANGQV